MIESILYNSEIPAEQSITRRSFLAIAGSALAFAGEGCGLMSKPLEEQAEDSLEEAERYIRINYEGLRLYNRMHPLIEGALREYRQLKPVWQESQHLRERGHLPNDDSQCWHYRMLTSLGPVIASLEQEIRNVKTHHGDEITEGGRDRLLNNEGHFLVMFENEINKADNTILKMAFRELSEFLRLSCHAARDYYTRKIAEGYIRNMKAIVDGFKNYGRIHGPYEQELEKDIALFRESFGAEPDFTPPLIGPR